MFLRRKNIYLTFYSYKRSRDGLDVSNGFSFCRDTSRPYEDIFIAIDTPLEKLRQLVPSSIKINKIYASISFPSQLNLIYPLLNSKWVLGGPLIENIIQRNIKLPCELVTTPFESYLGKPISSDFNYYFSAVVERYKAKNLYYSCNLGHGCYWSKCKFCDYNYFKYNDFIRPNTSQILRQLSPYAYGKNYIHTGLSAMPANTLKTTLNTKMPNNIILSIALRADPGIKKIFELYGKNTSNNNLYNIGLESLSQSAINILNKNINIKTLIEIVEIIMQSGKGIAFLSIMDHYAFTNKQIVEESLQTIQKLDDLVKKYSNKGLFIYNAGQTIWENKTVISEFTDDFIVLPYTTETKVTRFQDYKTAPKYYKLCDKYIANIPEDSDVFKYNQQIALALTKTNINITGREFISLKNVPHRKSLMEGVDYIEAGTI